MLRLLLDGTEIDLYENESVNLTLQFSDVANINATKGSFSQTFRVPATPNNLDFFGNIHEPSAVDVINVKEKIPAELVSGTLPVVRGFCQVKAVYIQKKKYADIELCFFGEAVDLRTAIGDGMLSDLDLSAYDHDLTLQNIVDSWTSTSGIAPEIRYGLIDKGFNWSFPENPPWSATDGIEKTELTPFIKVKTIFDAIMDEAGYTYDSSFFDATGDGTMENMYMPAFNGSQQIVSSESYPALVQVGLTADIQSGSTGLTILPMVDTISNGTDEGSNWNNTTHKFTVPENGQYKLTMNWSWTYEDATHGGHLELYLYGNLTGGVGEVELFQMPTNGLSGFGILQELVIGLKAGDEIYYKYKFSASGHDDYIIANNRWNYAGTGLQVALENLYSIIPVDMASNMPKMKKIDFITGLQKMFNLVFVPDKYQPKHLLIEPFTDYTSAGTTKDWTNLVDYGKDLTITPTTDLQAKQYQWTYLEGKDFISDQVQKSLERVYGRYQVTEPDNDFATGEKKIEAPFGQYMTSLLPGTSYPIHRAIQSDGQIIGEPLPMIAYWHGVADIFGEWYIKNDAGTTTGPETYFPSFSNFSQYDPTIGDNDLNFGMERPLFEVECPPWNTLFFDYWAQYVNELYSDEARILKCTLRLTRTEIANFEFSDRIFIKDSYWRVLKMSYDANIEGMVEVEMIKILSDVGLCDDTPTSYDPEYNFILFNNSTISDIDAGSKTCCEKYGYQWLYVNQSVHGGATFFYLCKPYPRMNQPSQP